MRRHIRAVVFTLILATALIAAGCTGGKKQPGPGSNTQTPPAGQTDPSGAPGTAAGTPEPAQPVRDLQELVTAVPAGTVEHVTLAAGTPIDRTGLFFLNTSTGAIDGWIVKTGQDQSPSYTASPDNRWIVASAQVGKQQTTCLVDRKSGKGYQWDTRKGRLLAAGGSHLLFEDGGRFWLTGEEPTQGRPLAVTPAAGENGYHQLLATDAGYNSPKYLPSQALFSPDGSKLFLLNGLDLYLANPDSGEVKSIAQLPPKESGIELQDLAFEPLQAGHGVTLKAHYAAAQPNAAVHTRVLGFGWDGQKLAELALPHDGNLSPDGRFVWWGESLGGFAPAVVLGDPGSIQPVLRADGARFGTGWLADGSGLVVRTQRGYQILGTNGALQDVPAFAGTHGLNQPIPAPDKADRFAIGWIKVLKADGSKVAEAIPFSQGKWFGTIRSLAPWGYTGDELRFALQNWGGKGYSEEAYILPPRVERPPFDAAPALAVNVPVGDCLNLRTGFSKTAPAVTCLPAGTRLHTAKPPGRENKGWLQSWGNPVSLDMGGEFWLYVRTDAGERGYVALVADYLTWAPAQPGATPPDTLLERIADEKANEAWWLSVALGETQCGTACSDGPSFESIIMSLYNREKTNGGLAADLRADAAFDAARHEAALKPLEQASALLLKTWSEQGQPAYPEPSAAWQQAAREMRAILLKP